MTRGGLDGDPRGDGAEARAAGGAIDAIYYCPHDWDAGCECRKPDPGLLFQAQRDLNLDLTPHVFLGDDERDAEAADAAGCPSSRGSPQSLAASPGQSAPATHRQHLRSCTCTIKRVLITGHHGYVGSVMAPLFAEPGYDVVGLDVGLLRCDCTFVPDESECRRSQRHSRPHRRRPARDSTRSFIWRR